MNGLGVLCTIKDGRPIVCAVLLQGEQVSASVPTLIDRFDHITDPRDDFGLQLLSLGGALESRLKDMVVDAAVVRSMDWLQSGRRGDWMQKRYCTEGVLLSIIRSFVQRTAWLNGAAVGKTCGTTKAKIEEQAMSISSACPKEAIAAALAALTIAAGD